MDERVVRTILRLIAVLMILGAAVYLTILPVQALCLQSMMSAHNDTVAVMGLTAWSSSGMASTALMSAGLIVVVVGIWGLVLFRQSDRLARLIVGARADSVTTLDSPSSEPTR